MANVKDGGFNSRATINAYASAFRAYRIDIATLPVEDAARRIRTSRKADDLIAALDDWTRHIGAESVSKERLAAIARAAETDPVRFAIRESASRRDAAALRRLCEGEDDRRKLGPRVRYIFDSLLNLDPEGSFPLLETILREHPSDFWLNQNLGRAYTRSKPPKLSEAVHYLSIAVALRPDSPGVRLNLGSALRLQRQLDQAIAEYRVAIRIKPEHAEAHCNLGLILHRMGKFGEALESLERGHALGSKQSGWQYPSEEWVREAQRLVDLEVKLPAILKGEATPKDSAEWLAFAEACFSIERFATSARFCSEAFAETPALANELGKSHRFNAARSASLAASGQGKDEPMPGESAKAKLREQALGWLRADLVAWGKVLDGANDPDRKQTVAGTLAHWKEDAALAGIRNPEALAKLPKGEREGFRALWAEVDRLLAKAWAALP